MQFISSPTASNKVKTRSAIKASLSCPMSQATD
jgi:hypothetical protein